MGRRSTKNRLSTKISKKKDIDGIDPEFLAECVALYKKQEKEKEEEKEKEKAAALRELEIMADDFASPQSTAASLEAKYYYHGLPSKPVLVARSGTDTWRLPPGPDAHLRVPEKELRPGFHHGLSEVWGGHLGRQTYEVLDSMGVKWTSMDVVRIGVVDEYEQFVAPVIIWIGVKPGTLSREDGLAAVKECKKLLVANDIDDVEVEIRESEVHRWGSINT